MVAAVAGLYKIETGPSACGKEGRPPMPVAVTLFEHEHTIGFGCTQREAAALERLNRATGTQVLVPVLVGGRCEVQAFQHVGIVRLCRRTVQVLPRMYQDHSGRQDHSGLVRQATRNLLVLLSRTGQLPLREYALASVLRRELDSLEILTRLFATHLKAEWRRGPTRPRCPAQVRLHLRHEPAL